MKDYLEKEGVNFSQIPNIINYIYKNNKGGAQSNKNELGIKLNYGKFCFYYIKKFKKSEAFNKPIGILVNKQILEDLSHFHFWMIRENDDVDVKFKKITLDGESYDFD